MDRDIPCTWISVNDDLPPPQRMVLLHTPSSQRGRVDYGFRDFADGSFKVQTMIGWANVENFGGKVEHWMYLPEPPHDA